MMNEGGSLTLPSKIRMQTTNEWSLYCSLTPPFAIPSAGPPPAALGIFRKFCESFALARETLIFS
jgi:hypothetical protein